ncbi:response regulator transcription factor [Motilibacter aurantiacus]|uniref:response regulator transcription factor n=1 Tax=Motilibacter aurantiacus TaxID=2714955 RepID=UPI00140726F2|nr:response regulator transcription factor [Motilibacter aurantiacus]NHC46130.1 response regulator transcription factor [Motilibacter aurantiacus]
MTTLIDRTTGALPVGRPARFTALVVVGNPFARESVARTLRALGARDVLEAASAAEARARSRASATRDLAVVATALPDGVGLGLLAELRTAGWQHGVVLSGSADPYAVRAALTSGARGFVVSGAEPVSAVPSVPAPLTGGPLRPVDARPASTRGAVAQLSSRELEVLSLVANGQSNKDVGEALGLSALTVKSHLARIARKLGTGDRAEMVMVALRAGAID